MGQTRAPARLPDPLTPGTAHSPSSRHRVTAARPARQPEQAHRNCVTWEAGGTRGGGGTWRPPIKGPSALEPRSHRWGNWGRNQLS